MTTTPALAPQSTAADLLRAALDNAPRLSVETSEHGDLTLWADDLADGWANGQPLWTANSLRPEAVSAARLIGVVVALAPHLPDLLDVLAAGGDPCVTARKVRHAIEEAAR